MCMEVEETYRLWGDRLDAPISFLIDCLYHAHHYLLSSIPSSSMMF